MAFFLFSFWIITATSSKDDLHRRIGGRCSTNNMKVVFKVCCAPEENQQQQNNITSVLSNNGATSGSNNNMNNNIPNHQQPPTHQSTGVSINTNIAKTKTPTFADQVPSTSTNAGIGNNNGRFIPSINTNTSNIVQSTMNWPTQTSSNSNNHQQQPFYPSYVTSPRTPTHYSANNNYNYNSPSTSQTSLSHKPTKKTSTYIFYYYFISVTIWFCIRKYRLFKWQLRKSFNIFYFKKWKLNGKKTTKSTSLLLNELAS